MTAVGIMKCFHFTGGERDEDVVVPRKVSWARSLSLASTNLNLLRSEFDTESRRDWANSSELFRDFLTQGRANDLRAFTFPELRSATRGFRRNLVIDEGGFGCVYLILRNSGVVEKVDGGEDGCGEGTVKH